MLNDSEVQNAIDSVTENVQCVQPYVDNLVNTCCNKLDEYMNYVSELLRSDSSNITDVELDDIILTIPTLLYYVGTQQERFGVLQDVSESSKKLMYNDILLNTTGTVAQKSATAEKTVFNEEIVTLIYKRACSTIKSKIQFAMELLQSAKKVSSRRMTETELSRITPNSIRT